MQKPSERHKLISDKKITKFKKAVHNPFNNPLLIWQSMCGDTTMWKYNL